MTKKSDLVKEISVDFGTEDPETTALFEGLTEQQQTIARFKMRGISQKRTAEMLELTPARISQEVKAIREHFISKGSNFDQAAIVGESLSVYEEVEQKAWGIFQTDPDKKLRALETVMAAREKLLKLLMDLGAIKRAPTEHAHEVTVSPAIRGLTEAKKQEIVARILETSPGEEPEPPEEEYDDAELV